MRDNFSCTTFFAQLLLASCCSFLVNSFFLSSLSSSSSTTREKITFCIHVICLSGLPGWNGEQVLRGLGGTLMEDYCGDNGSCWGSATARCSVALWGIAITPRPLCVELSHYTTMYCALVDVKDSRYTKLIISFRRRISIDVIARLNPTLSHPPSAINFIDTSSCSEQLNKPKKLFRSHSEIWIAESTREFTDICRRFHWSTQRRLTHSAKLFERKNVEKHISFSPLKCHSNNNL